MRKFVACIIARTNSTRLEKKVLLPIGNSTLIEYLISKIKMAKNINEIYLCTSVDDDDKVLLSIAEKNNIKKFAGSRESVISRILEVAEFESATDVIRITADNMFIDERYIDLMIKYHQEFSADYTRTELVPLGLTAEIIKVEALKKCYSMMNPDESQYLMLYMFQPANFKCLVLIPEESHRNPEWSLTIDTPNDWERTKSICVEYGNKIVNYNDIIEIANKKNIPNLKFSSTGVVKFPAGIQISFGAYRAEMNNRIEQAIKVYLNDGEYSNG